MLSADRPATRLATRLLFLVAGFVVLLTAPGAAFALAGFALIAAISTTAYADILAGPAGIGFVARATGLHTAFWMLAGLLARIPVCANLLTAPASVRTSSN